MPGYVWPFIQMAVALILLALLWRAVDGPAAARSLANAQWPWLVLAVSLMTVQTILSALRWQIAARQLGMLFSTGHAIREYYLAQVVNQSLPGGMVGDAGRAYRARQQVGMLASGQAVVIERLIGQLALFATMAAAFVATYLVPGGLDWPDWLAIPMATLVLAGLLLPFALWAMSRMRGAVGRALNAAWRVLKRALGDRRALAAQILLSIGTTFCTLAAFASCAHAVGVSLSVAAVTALVPLILLTMLIPVSVSGWGFREGAAAVLLPVAGATASGGFATSVAYGLCFVAAVLPGLVIMRLRPQADH